MGRDSRRRWVTLARRASAAATLSLTLTVALTLTLTALAVSPSAASPKKGTALAKTPKLAQAGHATFWDCPSKTTEMLVVVNTLDPAPRRDPRRLVHRAQRRDDLVQLHRPVRRRGARPDVHLPDGRPLRLRRLRDRELAPPQRLARRAGRELPGTRLRAAGGGRHRVGHRLVEPDRAEQHAPGAAGELHPHGREQALQLPPARRESEGRGRPRVADRR